MANKIDTVLIDLSGTIHIDDNEIPGSIFALKKLRSSGVKLIFLTNTTKESRRILYEKLLQIGFSIDQDEILTSLTVSAEFVARKKLKPYLMLEDEAMEDFSVLGLCGSSESEYNAVVIGLAPSMFNYECLNVAFRLLLNGADLIAIHKGRYFKKKDGLYLGPGLEQATGKIATVLGKPEKDFFHAALKKLNAKPETSIMIGDDYKDDIQGAIDAGINTILVKTGKYQLDDEMKLKSQTMAVCSNFAEAVDFILKHNKYISMIIN